MFLMNVNPYDLGITCLLDNRGHELLSVEPFVSADEIIAKYPVSNGFVDLPTNHKLSDFFDYGELIRSDRATKDGLDNRVPEDELDIMERATYLAKEILDPTREAFGSFRPNSWFRGQQLEYALTGQKGFVTWLNKSYRPSEPSDPSLNLIIDFIRGHQQLTSLQKNNGGSLGKITYALWLRYYNLKQHPKGEAVDLSIAKSGGTSELRDWFINTLRKPFDQLILEFHDPIRPNSGWVHYSLIDESRNEGRKNRRMSFEIK